MKKLITEYLAGILDLFGTPLYTEILKITRQFLWPIWERVVDIAREKRSQRLTHEVEEYLRYDWLLVPQPSVDELNQGVDKLLKGIEEMPNKDFVQRILIPSLVEPRYLNETVKVRLVNRNEGLFYCVECWSNVPIRAPWTEARCPFCDAGYERI